MRLAIKHSTDVSEVGVCHRIFIAEKNRFQNLNVYIILLISKRTKDKNNGWRRNTDWRTSKCSSLVSGSSYAPSVCVIIMGGTRIWENVNNKTLLMPNLPKQIFYKSSRLNLVYICAIGFVHHSDQSIHLILISVLILPACFLWVVVGLPDQKLMKWNASSEDVEYIHHAWVVHVAGFRDDNKVFRHLMLNFRMGDIVNKKIFTRWERWWWN